LADLTLREREILVLVAMGLSNADIAERLVISPATAKTHVNRTVMKLQARDRAQLIITATDRSSQARSGCPVGCGQRVAHRAARLIRFFASARYRIPGRTAPSGAASALATWMGRPARAAYPGQARLLANAFRSHRQAVTSARGHRQDGAQGCYSPPKEGPIRRRPPEPGH
jgi:DNA-binding CsgD family transcriptional regulator